MKKSRKQTNLLLGEIDGIDAKVVEEEPLGLGRHVVDAELPARASVVGVDNMSPSVDASAAAISTRG